MNKVLALGLLVIGAASASFAQGTINFVTFNSDPSYGQVFLPDGFEPLSDYALGQLWYNNTGPGSPLTEIGSPVAFSSVTPGYIFNGNLTLPESPGTTIWYSLRVWNVSAGSTWEVAQSNPLLSFSGESASTSIILGGIDSDGNIFPTRLANTFPTFQTQWGPIPEPSVFSLFTVGVLLLGWQLRRRITP